MKPIKTNAIRLLEKEHIHYELIEYDVKDGVVDGVSVAEKTNQAQEIVYKTLVTIAGTKELVVFLIPVAKELDLKKAARTAKVKKVEMLPLKDLTKETGYIRGGCSAVGMKKRYRTFIDLTAEKQQFIIVSAGRPGLQMKVNPEKLATITNAIFCDVVKDR